MDVVSRSGVHGGTVGEGSDRKARPRTGLTITPS
jgi:hypothetical protein